MTVLGFARRTSLTRRAWPSASAIVVRSCASRPLMNGMLPTTTTAASAPLAAATALSSPLRIVVLAKRAASAGAGVRASFPSAPTVTYVPAPNQLSLVS